MKSPIINGNTYTPTINNSEYDHGCIQFQFLPIIFQLSFTLIFLVQGPFYVFLFTNTPYKKSKPTYQLLRTTTSCWCGRCGRDVVWCACGTHLFHNVSPNICWRRYARPRAPLKKAVHTHQTPGGHTAGIHLRLPSCGPNQRCGSLNLFRETFEWMRLEFIIQVAWATKWWPVLLRWRLCKK